MREYVAMHSVTSLPFKDLILSATDKPGYKNSEDRAWNIPQPLMEFFESNLNDSQLEAIHVSLSLALAHKHLSTFCDVAYLIYF